MSELTNARSNERDFRWQLLSTVSAVALLAAVYGSSEAKAADQDADRPTVWIELGGEMDHVTGQGDPFAPGFLSAYPASSVLQNPSPLQAQNPPPFSFGGDGKISFEPKGFDWVFSASIQYGRSSNNKEADHQTNGLHHQKYRSGVSPTGLLTQEKFADTKVTHNESYAILDFQAGKDVGLGLFGRDSSSILSLGVRFAQFSSSAKVDIRARPDLNFKYFPSAAAPTHALIPHYHTYHAIGNASRSFHGIGPSLSWNGSTPFAGNPQNGEVTFDWGANAALLFGRQRAHVRHQETGHYFGPQAHTSGGVHYSVVYQHPSHGHNTDRFVVVPNAGGFAGVSYNFPNAKVSLGYRADLFFGAIDGGIDTRKSETLGFYGPFAGVSIGLGG